MRRPSTPRPVGDPARGAPSTDDLGWRSDASSFADDSSDDSVRDVDLANLEGGIYIYNSTGTLTIENVRSRNIGTGNIGSGRSNHIQFAESSFSGGIRNSKFLSGRPGLQTYGNVI